MAADHRLLLSTTTYLSKNLTVREKAHFITQENSCSMKKSCLARNNKLADYK